MTSSDDRPRRLEDVERRLRRAGCVAADDEAAALVAAAPDDDAELERLVARREQGEPLPWIVGRADFGGVAVRVDAGVFVPRPHSVGLARRAATALLAGGRLADLCTGCGAIAMWVRRTAPAARVVGVDLAPTAVTCARSNGVPAVVGDLGAPLRDHAFDVVTAVVPYVPTPALRFLPTDVQRHEPRRALDGGDDGLTVARRLVEGAPRLLRPGGALLLEAGGDQAAALHDALAQAGFVAVQTWSDEDGDLRGVEARRPT